VGANKTSIFFNFKITSMKKLRITIKEFYEELHPLLESENVKFSYKRHGSHMKVEVSQDFCTKFGY